MGNEIATKGMLTPTTFEGAVKFSETLASSSMVPAAFKGKPADILVAVQWGSEVGLAPMQALQNIAVINGRPALYGDALLALVLRHPEYGGHQETLEGETATCTIVRIVKGREVTTTRTFSIGDAKRANLWGKAGPWKQHPKRMLQMRARGFAIRDAFADALKGVIGREEADDLGPPRQDGEDGDGMKDITPPNPLDVFSGEDPGKSTGEVDATEASGGLDDPAVQEEGGDDSGGPKGATEEIDPDAPLWELRMPKDGEIQGHPASKEWIEAFVAVVNRIADDSECAFKVRRHDIAGFKKLNDDTIARIGDIDTDAHEQLGKDYKRLLRMLSAKAKEAGE